MRVNIIGGGLAGCALAYVLKKHGAEPVIYEASGELATGASGNEVGLYNPRFTAQKDDVGTFYSLAFYEALKVFEELGDEVEWSPCGALHLMNDEKKQRRFPKTVESWGWGDNEMRIVDAHEASDISGVEIHSDCLLLSESGKISPKKLCGAYAAGVEVHLNRSVEDIAALDGEATILACGLGVRSFDVAKELPLRGVRGQVTYVEESDVSKNLQCTIGFGGYIAPSENGVHCLGSTFQRWLDHTDLLAEDDVANIEKLGGAVPSLKSDYRVVRSKAGMRTTSPDHFPVVGALDEGVYVCTAHGSHGILSSLLSAIILSDSLLGVEEATPSSVLGALSPSRFLS